MNINKYITSLVLVLFCTPLFAQEVSVGPRGEKVPVTRLGSIVSYENEEKVVFLSRVGRLLHNYTQNNGFEACACICEGDGGYGVVVHTNESQIACATMDVCPNKMVKTDEMIHSHPILGQNIRLNKNDVAFMSMRPGQRVNRHQITRARAGFSDIDKSLGSGYLVESEMLMYFDGKNEHTLMPVADSVFNQNL